MQNMNLTKLSDRIKFIRESQKISKKEFARRLEISAAYISELESGQKTTISGLLAKMIQYEFAINREWLLEGKGTPFIIESNNAGQIVKTEDTSVNNLSKFESLLSEISATYINLPIEKLDSALTRDFTHLNKLLGVDLCILYTRKTEADRFYPTQYFAEDPVSMAFILNWLKNNPGISEKTYPYVFAKWNRGEPTQLLTNKGLKAMDKEIQTLQMLGVKSALSIPIRFSGSVVGALNVSIMQRYQTWPEDMISRLRLFGEVFINAIMRKEAEEKLQKALSEIKKLKERFEADYLYLSEEIKDEYNFEGIVGKSEALKKILVKVKQVGPTDATVLILGETGTGKGLIARAIHDSSSRSNRPLIQVNCAALAPTLIESELFGHEKGSFTGATTRRLGRFETAKGTTLFLDEIGDLPLELQAKLLRVLEEGEFERVGGNSTIHTDIRLIAATSRNLEEDVKEGRFRSDLWYRLNIFPIFVPPLRERIDDIPLLIEHFVEKYQKWARKKFKSIPLKTINAFNDYDWPGNIRELSNIVERAVITSHDGTLKLEIPLSYKKSSYGGEDLKYIIENIEREKILKALQESNWVIKGKNGAAQRLGYTPSTLRYRVSKLEIRRPESS